MLSELEKQRAWEVYKILIQQNATFVDNQRYCKDLVHISLNIVETFDFEINRIHTTLSPLKEEIKSNV